MKRYEYTLQLVPFKEPRPETFEVITKEPELAGFDDYKFVIVDIGVDSAPRVNSF